MRIFIAALLCISLAFGMKVEYRQWEKGKTFSDYLNEKGIPHTLLQSISEDDKKFLLEIRSDKSYYESVDENGTLDQALIPISEEMQIHLFRKKGEENAYGFDIIPIIYQDQEYFGHIKIEKNPYTDALKNTHYPNVAKRLGMALKGVVNIKKLRKGDEVAFVYRQKTRLGEVYAMPRIEVVKVHTRGKDSFIYVDEDGNGYSDASKKVAYTVTGKKKVVYTRRVGKGRGKVFGMPLHHIRITSSFSYRRWHPILHRYRPHHGTDFGARRGTPLLAVNDGTVIYAGWMGGYGRVVKIKHTGGYISLYAHQSRMRVKRGQHVRKGQIIGYVGSSGRSTGPHLHFGLMKNGRWIDPMKVLRRKSVSAGSVLKKFTRYENVKTTKYKKVEIKGTAQKRKKIEAYLMNNTPSYIWDKDRFDGKLKDEELLEETNDRQD